MDWIFKNIEWICIVIGITILFLTYVLSKKNRQIDSSGGDVNISAGDGGQYGDGGNTTIKGGDENTSGKGGDVLFKAGDGGNSASKLHSRNYHVSHRTL